MSEYKSEIDTLLDCLDTSANSNTAWLSFEVNKAESFNIQEFLLTQLRTGYFHFVLLENDLQRGWEHYVSVNFSKQFKDAVIALPRPGTTWNGTTKLDIDELTEHKAQDMILDLLTGEQKHFNRSYHGKQLMKNQAEKVVNDFIKNLKGPKEFQLAFYNIKPNFLWTEIDCFQADNDHTKLGYFENDGKDFALAITVYDEKNENMSLKVLMTNGYS